MHNTHLISTYLQERLPKYLELLKSMVAINSFTANQIGVNRLGELTAAYFQNFDFQAEYVPSARLDFGNHLFLTRPAIQTEPRRSIVMVSHLDTVFPPEEEIENHFFWRIEQDQIYGPGTIDIKGGTVMIYMVLDALSCIAPEIFASTSWLIALDASEEALSEDFGKHTLERAPANSLACLVFEGGTVSPGRWPIVVARKGRATFTIQAFGRSAHAGNNHAKGANAILQLAQTIQDAAAIDGLLEKTDRECGHGERRQCDQPCSTLCPG